MKLPKIFNRKSNRIETVSQWYKRKGKRLRTATITFYASSIATIALTGLGAYQASVENYKNATHLFGGSFAMHYVQVNSILDKNRIEHQIKEAEKEEDYQLQQELAWDTESENEG